MKTLLFETATSPRWTTRDTVLLVISTFGTCLLVLHLPPTEAAVQLLLRSAAGFAIGSALSLLSLLVMGVLWMCVIGLVIRVDSRRA